MTYVYIYFVFAGDLVPPYKAMLLNAFLVGTKDSDHLVRASSLSNLGEICKALGFRIGPIVREVSTFFCLVNTCHAYVPYCNHLFMI
jgi:hypothetical protein